MKRAAILLLGTALCVAPVALTGSIEAAAQAKSTAKAAYKAPRNAFGQPDLSGFWTNNTMTPMTRRANYGDRLVFTPEEVKQLEAQAEAEVEEGNQPTDPNAPAEARRESTNTRPEFAAAGGDVGGYDRGWLDPGHSVMRVNGEPRTSLLTTPNGQFPPRKAGAPPVPGFGGGGRGGMGSFDSYETRSLGERCIIGFGRNGGPPMFPNGFYNNNYEFIQTPDTVVIQVEMNHDLRVIRLNGKHRTDGVRPYFGDSIGWWEGDTLVVETVNIPRSQQFAGSWENLKVTERFTRVGDKRIHYQFTVDDPTIWEKPWGGEYEFAPLAGRIFEYACHEGNYALPGILGGARAEEQAAAEEAAAKAKADAAKPAAKGKGKAAEVAKPATAGE
ncbi:hypothetical protein LRS10_09880 [Phenylobacterium sp. J426]|uniref:hypothetical protein n=1 Tax=Phenylobacterium sp. J426 TaxID=2898439 RepID=UPI0021518F65|nr:hypothetical protein [Phenylobacterium sp. J426]MCR5874450.1 hypothetical protein [Phenylobacterium sp. J426]